MMAGIRDKFESYKNRFNEKLHEKNQVTDILAQVEKSTKVDRLYLASGLLVVVGVWLLVGYGAQILCSVIGFLYPAYASVKAIESKSKDDDTQWLLYWTVYSCFALSEMVTDIFLFWIPCYWFLKCIFLVWCMAPVPWNGSTMLYGKFIRPFVLKYEERIDRGLDKAKAVGANLMDEGKPNVKVNPRKPFSGISMSNGTMDAAPTSSIAIGGGPN